MSDDTSHTPQTPVPAPGGPRNAVTSGGQDGVAARNRVDADRKALKEAHEYDHDPSDPVSNETTLSSLHLGAVSGAALAATIRQGTAMPAAGEEMPPAGEPWQPPHAQHRAAVRGTTDDDVDAGGFVPDAAAAAPLGSSTYRGSSAPVAPVATSSSAPAPASGDFGAPVAAAGAVADTPVQNEGAATASGGSVPQDLFDVSPVTDTDGSANTLAEDAAGGTAVGIVANAKDADATDSVSYAVDDARFTVDPDGTVRVADGASFDAETESSIDVTVTATSTDGSTSSETFAVDVTDVNESAVSPVTDTDASANTLAEDASGGTAVGIVANATDADATDTVSYSVDDARFTVDPDGTIRVADGASFDAETESSIDVTVTATSTDGSTSSETFAVDVTDVNESAVSPVIDTDASANTLAEDASGGTAVGIVANATDSDATDTVSYSVDDARFTVDLDGTVRVADGASFDAESEGSIDVTVTATSTDGSTSSETFAVDVTDVNEAAVSPVTDTDGSANTLAEDASGGTAVGIVANATDSDQTDTVSYSVDDARFTVDSDGTVRIADGASFDAESEGSIDVTVTATSTDGSTSSETFSVDVTDVNESAVSPVTDTDASANTLAEDAAAGTAIGIVANAQDSDATDSVSYAVDDARFTVDPDGTIRVADGASFDAKTESSIDVTVTATSTDGSTSSETFAVDVTDVNESAVSPVIDTDASANTLAEDASGGTAVGIVANATDSDATDTVSYSVDDARFTVDPDGTVRVADGASFDAESEGSIDVTVTATSTDGSTSSETFSVDVTDVNESAVSPVTDTDASANTLAEDASGGTAVGIVANATDSDATDSVSYSIDDARFTVDLDGTVRVADGASFDAESEGSIDVTVTATSTDGSTSSETFAVDVTDVNESAVSTVTDTDGSTNTLAEDAAAGTAIGIVANATDADATDSVSYAVDDARFTVDPDGTVRVADGASFDAETEGSIDVTVTATSTDGSTSSETFSVDVTDVNESAVSPVTDTDASANTLAEDASIGTTVGIVANATDSDATDSVSYSVDDARFTVDPDGTVRVTDGANFDAETESNIDVTVTATSTDGSTSSETFSVDVTDVNESAVSPVTDTDASANTLAEDASGGTAVGIVANARDSDATDTVSYSVDDARFTVDPDGTVRVADGASFDAESEGSIDVTVTATSTDGSTSSETFAVDVTDVNESAVSPVIDTDASANTLAEDASTGTTVGIVANATDSDQTDTVSYSVDDARFTVDSDGTVRVADGASFDAETESSIDVTVTATSTDGSTSSETFAVDVTDVNESAVSPVTDTDASANTLAEDASTGTTVGIVANATDADATDSVSYSVDDARFTVDPDGTIRVADGASFDAETEGSIDVTVTATSTDGSTSSETFAVDVTDVNESAVSPVTDTDGSANTLAEDASTGTTVGIVANATDADQTDTVSYSVDDTRFTVDPDGTIRVADGASFDAETESSIDVTVTATSTDGSTSSETFAVDVTDVNESAVSPVTDTDGSANTLAEDAAFGTAVGIVANATDADATDSVSYAVDDARFTVDPDGTIRVADGASFDAETESSIDVTVTATSTDGSTSSETFAVDVTDVNEAAVSPVIDTDASANTLAENASIGTTVGIVANATDSDATDSVSYSVDDARFTVDPDGTVRIADGASFDAETEGSIDVTVTATSTDGSTSSETFAVDVTDVNEAAVSPVTDTDASANTLAEDASGGTAVGIVANAKDADATDTVSYSVDDTRFTVDPDGTVRIADGASFDAETEGSIDVTVTATSTDGSTSSETFAVDVTDVNESAVSPVTDTDASANTLAEDAASGTAVGIVANATDSDATDSVSYSVDDARFTVDPDGTVRVADGASFDAETEGSIDVTVTATSTDGSTSSETFAVDVTDVNEAAVSPVTDTDSSANTLAEDASTGTTVGIVANATDADQTDTVSYSVDDARFTVDPNGTLRVADGASFDAETESNIDVTVTATSTDGTTSSETFAVDITDVNESAVSPVSDTDASANTLAEDAASGTTVGIVANATDADATDSVSYSVDDARFTVDPDGTVRVADGASFDAETEGSIDVTVTATSTDGSTSSETFAVDVTDVNESAVSPVIDTDASANTLAEDASTGTTVGIVANATDADQTDTVSYSVDDTRFTVDPDGTIRVADGASFDAESEGNIDVTVTATSTDGSTSSETFAVDITDVNESAVSPVTDTDASANTLAEDAASGTAVGIVANATDSDATDSVSYSVDDARFTVDPDGTVRVADGANFDAETEGSIDVTVTATSTDGSTSSETFAVDITDVNESAVSPVIDTDGSANTLAEDAAAGTAIGIVANATDSDQTDTVSYSVDDARFTVDPDGTVRVADGANFDAETEGSIDVTVTATSTDGSTSSETFAVDITDVNESAVSPVIDTDGSANTLAEDAAAGTAIGIVANATDSDQTDTVSYSVDDARFTVDPDGTVRVADGANFDAETEDSIDVTVTATSTDGSTSSETFAVDITDVNESAVSPVIDTDASANTLAEDASTGTTVGIVANATDSDQTDTVSYSVDDARFTVDPDGTIRIADGASFDAETEGSIDVTVTATSTDGSTSSETFAVDVTDVNESAVSPVTDTDASANTLAEDAASGTTVGIVANATDSDATDSVSYSVDDARFTVDPDGTVRVADGASFDAETEGSIDVTVTATSTDGSTSSETFAVDVTDVNESAVSPVTDTDASANTLAEDASTGTTVGIVANATDSDQTDTVSYSVDDARFTVDPDGTVRVADGASFDAESEGSIDVTVTATSTDGSTSSETFAVDITDVNESAVSPVIDTDASANTLAEDASTGTTVGIVANATDADESDSVSYAVDDTRFTVDPDGTVRVADGASFDAETESSIDVTVTATSTDGSTSSETFAVDVTNVIDETPTDIVMSGGTVDENSASGTVVATLSTVDADAGDSHSYAFTNEPSGFFEIVGNEIRVKAGANLDHETADRHTVTVQVTDSAGNTHSEDLDLAVNDVNEGPSAGLVTLGAVAEDGSLTITAAQLLANSSDVDGDSLTVSSVAVDPAYGTLADNGDGTWTFTPTSDYAANYVPLSFAVTDGEYNAGSWALVDVTAVADAPAVAVGSTTKNAFSTDFESGAASQFVSTYEGWNSDGAIEVRDGLESSSSPASTTHIELNMDPDNQPSGDDDDDSPPAFPDAPNIYRTVETEANGTYELTFDYAGRPGFDASVNRIEILWDGEVIATLSADGTASSEPVWQSYTVTLPGDGDPTRIEFREAGVDVSRGRGMFLDNIQIAETLEDAARGAANTAIDLPDLSGSLFDTDGSEALSLALSGLPNGTVISDGSNTFTATSDNASANVTGWNLASLRATPPSDYTGTMHLTVSATATEALNGDTATTHTALRVHVDGGDGQTLTGTSGSDTMAGTAYDDVIDSGMARDTVSAGAGDDIIHYNVRYNDGGNLVDGGDGTDLVDFSSSSPGGYTTNYGIGIDLATGAVIDIGNYNANGNYSFSYGVKSSVSNVEDVRGSAFNDLLKGDAGGNTLYGNAGDDFLSGRAGNDVLAGGGGDDALYGGDGADLFIYAAGDGSDTLAGGAGGGWTDILDLGDGASVQLGDYGTDWTVTITQGNILTDDSANGHLDLSQDAAGYIDMQDGSRIDFQEIEQIQW